MYASQLGRNAALELLGVKYAANGGTGPLREYTDRSGVTHLTNRPTTSVRQFTGADGVQQITNRPPAAAPGAFNRPPAAAPGAFNRPPAAAPGAFNRPPAVAAPNRATPASSRPAGAGAPQASRQGAFSVNLAGDVRRSMNLPGDQLRASVAKPNLFAGRNTQTAPPAQKPNPAPAAGANQPNSYFSRNMFRAAGPVLAASIPGMAPLFMSSYFNGAGGR